jgi:hypothetical protein
VRRGPPSHCGRIGEPGYKLLALNDFAVVEVVDLEYGCDGEEVEEVVADHVVKQRVPASANIY